MKQIISELLFIDICGTMKGASSLRRVNTIDDVTGTEIGSIGTGQLLMNRIESSSISRSDQIVLLGLNTFCTYCTYKNCILLYRTVLSVRHM